MVTTYLITKTLSALAYSFAAYVGLLAILTIPAIHIHVIYLHKVALTWFQDVDHHSQWRFLPHQVTPFYLNTTDGERLHAWHILPIGLYQQNEAELSNAPIGAAPDITQRFSFKLLRDDAESLLVLYFHGAAGTLGSGWRPPSYRAMHALAPDRIHTVAIDYRGFGKSTGSPSESGLLTDARALMTWAMEEAKIPPHRIVFFAQSMGTAVALSLTYDLLSVKPEPIHPKGIVLVAPFADAAELTSTYSIAGIFPLLGPLSNFPILHAFFKTFLICTWPSKERLAEIISSIERSGSAKYDITLLHAKDDWDIPWSHTELLFSHAVQANDHNVTEPEDVRRHRGVIGIRNMTHLSDGSALQRTTKHGILRREIVEYGLHDKIMSYPRVSLAVWRAFQECQECDIWT